MIAVWNEGQKYHGAAISAEVIEKDDMPVFNATKKWLDKYFAGKKPIISELPLAPIGGEFRKTYGLFYVKYHMVR